MTSYSKVSYLKSSHFDFLFSLQHFLKLFVLNFSISRIIDLFDELFYIYGQVKLLFYYPYQHVAVNVSRLIGRSTDGSVSIESSLVVFTVDLALSFLPEYFDNLIELNVPSVGNIELWNKFAEFELFKVNLQSLEHSLKVINTY